jgi:hypothetical protein
MAERHIVFLLSCLFFAWRVDAAEIRTNNITFPSPPSWLTARQVEQTTDRIGGKLEWDVRRVQAFWYPTLEAFSKVHGWASPFKAFFRPSDSTVHLGPEVTAETFDRTFGHELVHVIFFQKYKGAIPIWLEEGLANYLSQYGVLDYRWLAQQKGVADVTRLGHPTDPGIDSHYHYSASTALAEMIAAKCDLFDLLQLSVGKKFETYLRNTCGVEDVNASFHAWVKEKAGVKKPG